MVFMKITKKIFAASVLAVGMVSGVLNLAVTNAESQKIYGDFDGNSKVDNMDLISLCRYVVKDMNFDEVQLKLADFNNDKNVDIADIATLKQYVMGDYTQRVGTAYYEETTTTTTVTTTPVTTTTPPVTTTAPPVTTTQVTTTNHLSVNKNSDLWIDYSSGLNSDFEMADGWTNGNPFNCNWHKENGIFTNEGMQLKIDQKFPGDTAGYSGAECRSTKFYGYGKYEVCMKAIKNDGVVSSFFTYTGPSDNNPWDEIDVEILGKDTTKVQLNYYTNGVGGHEYFHNLGFDASLDYHTYAFEWRENYIKWFIDGKEVYTAYNNLPKTPGKIMMNVWPGIGVNEWLNPFNGKTPLTAHYKWVTYNK